MFKHLKDQRGVVPLVEVLVLVLVLLVGVAVFVRVQNANKSAKVEDAGGVKKKKPAPVPAKVTYFTIKELGVRFKLPDDIKDLTYSYSNDNNIPSARFSTQTLIDKDSSCKADGGPLGFLSQHPPGSKVFEEPVEQNPHAKKIGNFYYYYEPPQSPCSRTTNTEVQDLTIEKLKALKAALSSDNLANLEAAPN